MKAFRYLADPLCLVAWFLYALNRGVVLPHVSAGFFRGQFNDCLLVPAALPPVLWLQRRLGLRPHDQPPLGPEIGFHLLVWSVLFEVVGPKVLAVTGDPWDVAAYCGGGLLAWWWWNRRDSRIGLGA